MAEKFVTKDSGVRQGFDSGMVRDTQTGKPRPDLISPYASKREGELLARGVEKYGEYNWQKGSPISRCIASLERHLMQYKMGMTDEDHIAAVRVNAGFVIHYEEMIQRGKLPAELDDMPHYEDATCPLKPGSEGPFKVGDKIRVTKSCAFVSLRGMGGVLLSKNEGTPSPMHVRLGNGGEWYLYESSIERI